MSRVEQGEILFWTGEVRWRPLCATCGQPEREPHRHLSTDVAVLADLLLAELARRPAPFPERVGEREHLTLRQLVEHSGWSERWLRARTTDPVDPLPCSKRKGKLMFRRSEYDRWITRQRRRDGVAGAVGDVMARLGRP